MTLAIARRLVRQITELLQHQAHEAQAGQLAQDFADASRAAAQRLDQCAAMLQAGDDHQALQLAEATPALLDLFTVLGFKRAAEWRAYCHTHKLPVADPPEAGAVRLLNAAYGKGIPTDHRLYKDYRQAVLKNQPEQALGALRLIRKLNPSDQQAAAELERVEARVLKLKFDALAAALATGDADAVLRGIEETEALEFPNAPAGETWQEAQLVLARRWMEALPALREADDWRAARPLLDRVKNLCATHGCALRGADAEALADAAAWVDEEARRHDENERFEQALAELEHFIGQNEDRRRGAREPSLADLRNDLEAMRRQWREITEFTRAVPEDLEGRFHKTTQVLRAQIAGKARKRKNLLTVGAAGFVLAVLATGVWFMGRRTADDLASELAKLQKARQVLALSNLLAQIQTGRARLTDTPSLQSALPGAAAFLEQEHKNKANHDGLLARLAGQQAGGFKEFPPEETQRQFNEAEKAATELAPDFQPAAQARLQHWRGAWDEFLAAGRREREGRFNELLADATRKADGPLRAATNAAQVRAALHILEPVLQSLAGLTGAPLPALRVSQESLLPFQGLRERADLSAARVKQWEDVTAGLKSPRDCGGYLATLEVFRQSDFSPPAHRPLAADVVALSPSSNALLAAVLCPGDAALWAALQKAASLPVAPETAVQNEIDRLLALRNDAHIQHIVTCKYVEFGAKARQAGMPRMLFLKNVQADQFTNDGFGRPVGDIYDPQGSPGNLEFKSRNFKTDPAEETIQTLGPTKERLLFARSGLLDLFDGNTLQYRYGLFSVLDRINQDKESSPLFRAYLTLKLWEIIDLRPADWGVPWALAAREHREQLRVLVKDSLRSGDWMLPDKVERFGPRLEEHFAQARAMDYARQVRFRYKLMRDALDAGMHFAGYAAENGAARVGAAGNQRDLWGWGKAARAPARLFRWEAGQRGHMGMEEPMPFTPLFALGTDPEGLRRGAAHLIQAGPEEPEVTAALPPLFAKP